MRLFAKHDPNLSSVLPFLIDRLEKDLNERNAEGPKEKAQRG